MEITLVGRCAGGLLVALLLVAATARGQELAMLADSEAGLPNAPSWGMAVPMALQAGGAQEVKQGTASVAGVVLDISEAGVAEATVTLTQEGAAERVMQSGERGVFLFTELPAGMYHVTITAKGLETFVSSEISLRAGEHHELPRIALPIETATSSVQVTVTQDELAEDQIRAAVQQRVLGVLPNFYSSYIWNAAPLRTKHKFELGLRSITDPAAFIVSGIVAGVEQASDTFPSYHQGAEGYAKRLGAAYGDAVIGRMVGSAILPSLLHQDPRYFYRGSGSTLSRAWYAVTRSVICRGDNGRWQPNYSHVLGSLAAGGISSFYRPDRDRGVRLVERSLLVGTAGTAAVNLVREFALRRVTSKVPAYAQGKGEAAAE